MEGCMDAEEASHAVNTWKSANLKGKKVFHVTR